MKQCDAQPFDLVVTDRAMGEISGDQLAALVKQRRPGTPVLMQTGFGDLMSSAGELPDGVDLILSKPVRIQEFIAAVERLCSA